MKGITYLPGHRLHRRIKAIVSDVILNDPIDDLFNAESHQTSRAVFAAGQREQSDRCLAPSSKPMDSPEVPLASKASDV
jgi:hypothetical protein